MNAKSIEKILFWVLAGIIFLVPLIFWQALFFEFTSTKTFFFQIAVEIALVLWVYLASLRSGLAPKFGSISWAVAAFISALLVSAVFGADIYSSFWSGYERMLGVITWLHVFAFFLMLASFVRTEKNWDIIFETLTVSGVLASFYGFLQAGGVLGFGEGRIIGTLGNASFFASFLLLVIFIAFWRLIKSERLQVFSWWHAFSILVMTYALLLTKSRGAMLALFGGFIFSSLLFLVLRHKGETTLSLKNKSIKIIFASSAILIVFFGSVVFWFREDFRDADILVVSRLATISFEDRTARARILAWQTSWRGVKERPVLGWGPENYDLMFNKHYSPELFAQEPWFDRAHNIIFDMLGTVGFLGFALYLGIFATAARVAWMLRKKDRFDSRDLVGIYALFFAYFAGNMLTFDILATLMVIFTVFAYLSSKYYINGGSYEVVKKSNGMAWVSAVIAFILFAFVFYFVNWKPLQESRIGGDGIGHLTEREDKKGTQLVDRALSYNTYGDVDVRRFVAEYLFEFIKDEGQRNDEDMRKLFDFSIKLIDENISKDPENVRWVMYQGVLLNLNFDPADDSDENRVLAKRAEEMFRRAIELSPGRQQVWFELAQSLRNQGRIDEMWETLEKAKELDPRYPVSYLNIAFHALELGEFERAIEEIKWLEKNSWARKDVPEEGGWHNPKRDLELLARGAVSAGRFGLASNLYQEFVNLWLVSSDLTIGQVKQYLPRLASLYKSAGNAKKARETALLILEYDDSAETKAKVDSFLQTL